MYILQLTEKNVRFDLIWLRRHYNCSANLSDIVKSDKCLIQNTQTRELRPQLEGLYHVFVVCKDTNI